MGKHRKLVDTLSQRLEKLERKFKLLISGVVTHLQMTVANSIFVERAQEVVHIADADPRREIRRDAAEVHTAVLCRHPSLNTTWRLNPVTLFRQQKGGGAGLEVETVTAPTPKVITEEPNSLVPEIEGLLGQEGTPCVNNSIDLHECLVQRWTAILKDGLNIDTKDKVMKKYDSPRNCELLVTPKLNDEVAAAMNENGIKRDTRISGQQAVLASAITAVGKVLNTLITDSQNTQVIEALSDSARLLCDLYHDSSLTRRALILPSLNKDLKDLMEKSPISKFLFGDKLQERVTTCKAVKKSAQELKNTHSQPKLPVESKGHFNYQGLQQQMQRPSGPRPTMRRMTTPTMDHLKRSPQRQQHHPRRHDRSRR